MEEEKYMRRCISLARNGLCNTSPNLMVGAVNVCDGLIIGEGYHARFGEAQAEVNAIRSVKEPALLKRSTIYVSLEPCTHHGKTPPCADLIIEKKIPRVVIGCEDPFAAVAGRGIERLRNAGCEVVVGVLEEACKGLIRSFITFHACKRPYITLKWAESADGFIDKERTDGHPALLSTPLTSMLVHKRRAESDAILVGTRTAGLDNPSLTVRNWYGHNPTRVVIDKKRTLSPTLHLFDGSVPTIVFTTQHYPNSHHIEYITLTDETNMVNQMLTALYKRNIQPLLVEGGSQLLQSFINAGVWDEAFVELSAIKLSTGVKAPRIRDKVHAPTNACFGVEIEHYINRKA